jgi:hypothetical protein
VHGVERFFFSRGLAQPALRVLLHLPLAGSGLLGGLLRLLLKSAAGF